MDIGRIVLPALALALGIITSVYFVILWRRHRENPHSRALLFWAIALFLFYWFQLPAILIGLGRVVAVTEFSLFFSLTFPITFLALILVYLGILRISDLKTGTKIKLILSCWFALAIVFFGYFFTIEKGVINNYILPLAGNLLFYVPLRLLIILILAKLLTRPEFKSIYGILGCAGIIGESILGLMRNFLVIRIVLAYPPQFWYLALLSSRFFLVTQALSVILLVVGFCFLHRAYHDLRYKK